MESVPDVTTYPWPVLDASLATQRNRLLKASGRLRFEAGGSLWSVHVLPETPRGYRPAYAVEATVDGRPLRLDLDRLPLPRLLGYPLEGVPALEVPEDLLPALLEGALAGLLTAAETALGAPVRLETVRRVARGEAAWTEEEEHRLDLGLKEVEGTGRLRARLFLGMPEMEALASAAEAAPRPDSAPEAENLRADLLLRLVVRAGEVALPAGELAALAAGDVVLLDRDPASPGALRLGAGDGAGLKFQWTATRKGAVAVLDKEIPMETDDKPAAPEGVPAGIQSIDRLEVPLGFDLGARPATLGELRGFTAGMVVELPDNPEGRVTLRAGGRAIGAGTLVMLGDRAGVRIDSIWREDAP
jgi:type III secretion system YscQ/HrcQ family protein